MSSEGANVTVGEISEVVRKEFNLAVTTAGAVIISDKVDAKAYVFADNLTAMSEEIVNFLEDAGML